MPLSIALDDGNDRRDVFDTEMSVSSRDDRLRADPERDAAEISDFLLRNVPVERRGLLLADHHMQWKYWVPVRIGGFAAVSPPAIRASSWRTAAAWPVGVRIPGRGVPGGAPIDCGRGSGISRSRHLAHAADRRQSDPNVASGGSEMTRRILPIIGFVHTVTCAGCLPVRPLDRR